MSTKRLNIDILAKDKTRQALSGVQKNLSNVKNTVFSLKGALVGVGAGAVVRSFVNVGKEVESLQVRFKFLFGSVQEGSLAFDNLTKFASKVPFSLEEISRASGNLAVVADDANDLNRILEITGNVAAVTGLDFETTASQIQRAFSGGIGAADLFRERGVRALLGFKNGATVTAEETVARFEELFSGGGRFANATDDLATTLEGTLSMIGDKYFKFQKDVASGFFDELKSEFGDLNVFLEENEQQIKDIADAIGKNFAGAITTTSDLIKEVAPSVKTIANALGTTITGFKSLPTFVQTTGIIGALLFGKKGAIAFGAVSFLVGQIQELIDKSNELKETRGLQETFEAKELDAYKLSLEEINNLINSYKLSLDKVGGQIVDSADNKIILDQIFLLEQVADTIKLATADAEDYEKIQNSLAKVPKQQQEELEKVRELQNEINNQLERENLLRLSNVDGLKEFKEKYDPITAVIEEAQNEQIALNKLVNDGVITADQAARARLQIENELSENLQKIYQETEDLKTEQVRKNLELFKEEENARIEAIRKEGNAIENLQQSYLEFFNSFNEGRLIGDALFNSMMSVSSAIGDAVAQSVVFGKNFKETFGNAARQILAQLVSSLVEIGVKMLINATIGKAIRATEIGQAAATAAAISAAYATPAALVSLASFGANAIPAQVGLSSTVLLSNALAASGGIPRQNGGRVFEGQSYTVGENGREMFVPSQDGTIVSNRDMNKGTVVNVNIMANDTQGFDDLLVKRRSVIVNVINDALNSQGKEALV